MMSPTEPPEEIQIQRWPVLERATDKDGRLLRTPEGYKRTKQPLETRSVRVLDLLKSSVLIAFTSVSSYRFSVATGRCVGIPDWVLEKESRAALKKVFTARKRAATKERRG
jgi:hypothetical protein